MEGSSVNNGFVWLQLKQEKKVASVTFTVIGATEVFVGFTLGDQKVGSVAVRFNLTTLNTFYDLKCRSTFRMSH